MILRGSYSSGSPNVPSYPFPSSGLPLHVVSRLAGLPFVVAVALRLENSERSDVRWLNSSKKKFIYPSSFTHLSTEAGDKFGCIEYILIIFCIAIYIIYSAENILTLLLLPTMHLRLFVKITSFLVSFNKLDLLNLGLSAWVHMVSLTVATKRIIFAVIFFGWMTSRCVPRECILMSAPHFTIVQGSGLNKSSVQQFECYDRRNEIFFTLI